MDHRSAQRKSIALFVTVFQDGFPIVCTNTIDISRDGLALDSGPSFDVNTRLELEFTLDKTAYPKKIRIPATVTHSSTEGTGLCVFHTDDETRKIFDELLTGA